jgi:hypothetical protein
MRASDLLGATAYDATGRPLGRIVELVAGTTPEGAAVVRGVIVAPRRHLRLLGYHRHGMRHPAPIRWLADLLRRDVREVPWADLRLTPPAP